MISTRCDQCGQTDDHPKVIGYGGTTHHHDCLSFDQRAELAESSSTAAAIIAECESGTKGADLRAFIVSSAPEA